MRDKLVEQKSQWKNSTVEIENVSRQIKMKTEKRERLAARQEQLNASVVKEETSVEHEQKHFFAQVEHRNQVNCVTGC